MLLLHAAWFVSISSASQHDHFPHAGVHLHDRDILDEPSPTWKWFLRPTAGWPTAPPSPVLWYPGVTASVLMLTSVIHWMQTDGSSVCLVCGVGGVGGRKWILKDKEYELLVLYNSHLGVFCGLVNMYWSAEQMNKWIHGRYQAEWVFGFQSDKPSHRCYPWLHLQTVTKLSDTIHQRNCNMISTAVAPTPLLDLL